VVALVLNSASMKGFGFPPSSCPSVLFCINKVFCHSMSLVYSLVVEFGSEKLLFFKLEKH
jgi:hypothetical protein